MLHIDFIIMMVYVPMSWTYYQIACKQSDNASPNIIKKKQQPAKRNGILICNMLKWQIKLNDFWLYMSLMLWEAYASIEIYLNGLLMMRCIHLFSIDEVKLTVAYANAIRPTSRKAVKDQIRLWYVMEMALTLWWDIKQWPYTHAHTHARDQDTINPFPIARRSPCIHFLSANPSLFWCPAPVAPDADFKRNRENEVGSTATQRSIICLWPLNVDCYIFNSIQSYLLIQCIFNNGPYRSAKSALHFNFVQ